MLKFSLSCVQAVTDTILDFATSVKDKRYHVRENAVQAFPDAMLPSTSKTATLKPHHIRSSVSESTH